MNDGIPQLAGELENPQKLYAYLSDQLDILNGVLSETGANYSFQYGNDGGHFQVQKISPDEPEEIATIESLGHDESVNDELYSTGFAQAAAIRRSATGVMAFLKMRLIESIDMDTKIKMSGKTGAVPGGLTQIVLQGIENDPWKLIHENVSNEASDLNSRLQKVDAPIKFELLYDRNVLILSKVMKKDGGAETAVMIEPVESLPAYRVSFEDVSTELTLDGALARTRERIKTLLPDDVRADLLRLRLSEMESAQGGPQTPAP